MNPYPQTRTPYCRVMQYLLAPNTSFTVDPLPITLTLSFRDENKILELIYEKQICSDFYKEHPIFLLCIKNAYCAI